MKILLISTGGTINSEPDYGADKIAVFRPDSKSRMKKYIKELINPDFEVVEKVICLRDSGDITDELRDDIVSEILNSNCDNIVITHGTDTMIQTGKYLARKLGKGLSKKVILVGSFYPLSFAQSDAAFNLGFAFGKIEHLVPGVYIAMSSQIFDVDKVAKNRNLMRFVAT